MRRETKQGAAPSLVLAVAVGALVLVASGAAAQTSRVFVTSSDYNGNLGGLAGADAKCQSEGATVDASATWVAWLSTNSPLVNAKDRLTPAASIGPFVRATGGLQIADDLADLIDGSLDNSIATVGFNSWTGTQANGTVVPPGSEDTHTCDDWTITSGSGLNVGQMGSNVSTSGTWTDSSAPVCNSGAKLYCFETFPPPPPPPPVPVPASSPVGLALLMLLSLSGLAYMYRRQSAA